MFCKEKISACAKYNNKNPEKKHAFNQSKADDVSKEQD
jgi:hypothetical protein